MQIKARNPELPAAKPAVITAHRSPCISRAARACAVLVFPVLLGGCTKDAAWWDEQERNRPLLQRAAGQADQGDVGSAVRLYLQAIDNSPGTARAHLELALLYHDQVKDYVKAVYHYERYLELRPDTEKREMIDNRVRLAKQSFAGSLLQGKGASAVRIADLEKENTELLQRVEDLERELRRLRARGAAMISGDELPGATPASEASRPPPEEVVREAQAGADTRADELAVRTYRVGGGDTLSGIALKVYGDRSRWREIQKANEAILGESSRLQVGQVLVIP